MSKIKLMTDQAADIPIEKAKELGIDVLSFSIAIDGKSYIAGEDFTNHEFYEILGKSDKIPTHSQITAIEFMDKYEEIYNQGFEDLIYISINRLGSSTHDNAIMASKNFFDKHPDRVDKFKIHVIDSKIYAIAYGYAIIEAAKKQQKGATSKELISYLKDWFDSVEIYFAPYSLEFVKKSGRVSCAAAFVGELLGLKPIISFVDGKVNIVEKVRGEKAIIPTLIKHAKKNMVPKTPFLVISGQDVDEAKKLEREAEKTFGYKSEGIYEAGAVIAINAGPKIVGIVIKGNKKH